MIAGATRGAGGAPLGRHLANAVKNEVVELLEGRGLVAEGIGDQVKELTDMASHARTLTPLYHVHADPEPGTPWDDATRSRYWRRFEQEFGFERQPFAAVRHVFDGRGHEHRVYKRTLTDGTAIRLDHDYARIEKINRLHEFEEGHRLTPGAHNRAVAAAFEREGRRDIAQRMRDLGFDTMPRPRAPLTPQERHMQERTGILQGDVDVRALAAWKAGDGSQARRAALEDAGFRLAMGDKGAVLIDEGGGIHSLSKILGRASKAGGEERIGAAEVRGAIAGLDLPRYVAQGEDDRPRRRLVPDAARDAAGADPAPEPFDAAPALPVSAAGPAEEGTQPPPVPPEPASELTVLPAAPSSPAAPDGGRAAPSAPSAPLSSGGGGGGGGGTGSDEVAVEVLDPSRPGDLARFLSQTAAAEKRKERRLAQADDHVSKAAHAKAAEAAQAFGARIRDFLDEQRTEPNVGSSNPTTTQLGHPGPDSRGHSVAPGGPEAPEHSRRQGPEPDRLRSSFGGPGRPQPSGTQATAGAHAVAGPGDRGRAGADGASAGALEGDRGEPNQGGAGAGAEQNGFAEDARGSARAAARGPEHDADAGQSAGHAHERGYSAARRLRDRRAARHLAAAAGHRSQTLAHLIAKLRGTPDRIADVEARHERRDRIQEALSRSGERVEGVLSGAPFPDPESRNPASLVVDERARVDRFIDEAQARAQQARQAAEAARGRVGILGKLFGLPTVDRQEADAAEQAARDAEDEAASLAENRGHDIKDADQRGRTRAETRQADQDRWDGSREVREARREQHGNELVREAVLSGDPEIEKAAADNLDGAREELLRREEDEIKRVTAKAGLKPEHASAGPKGMEDGAPALSMGRR